MASNMFFFPPLIDTKIDQPEFELVLDRDKVVVLMKSQGVTRAFWEKDEV